MKVVFLENVPQVANAGDVKNVKDGFGRNYLIPRRLAVVATPPVLKQIEQQHQAADRRAAKLEAEAGQLAERLDGQTVAVTARAGSQGRLYGSVTNQDIAAAIEQAIGRSIDRRRIHLEAPIRRLGTYPVTVRFSSEHTATITVDVRTEGEAAAPAAAAPATTAEAADDRTAEEATEA